MSLACLKAKDVGSVEDYGTCYSVNADPIGIGDLPDREESTKGILIRYRGCFDVNYSRRIVSMHRLKTGPSTCKSVCDLRTKNANGCRNGHADVTCCCVYENLNPWMNVQSCDLGETWKWEISASFALGEGVNAVPDRANEYGNNNERDYGSPLALLSNFLKHFLLSSLGQALPAVSSI